MNHLPCKIPANTNAASEDARADRADGRAGGL
jgi:hypothetical protein